MLSRCLILCTLILMPSLAGVSQAPANVRHLGRNVLVAADQTIHNARCFLCSVEVEGHTTGSVHVFAGNVLLNGAVDGNVLVFGGNLTLASGATIGGHVLIFGGHLHQYSPPPRNPPTVFSPIIFLPIILVICAIIGALIVLARRMVRGPIAYPPLPRL